ncbi:MAG: tetratricopeptide repeat protein [Pirellulaceae bacterium]|nr:tetratricopeptide repeat protein [Pirellulaceae bacterium]
MSVLPQQNSIVPEITKLPVRYRRQINWRLTIISIVILAVGAPAVFVWHQYQLKRVSAALLNKANESESAEKYGEASSYLYRYLQMMAPDQDQTEILARIAEVYDKSITTGVGKDVVIQWYYRALGVAPERTDLRNRLAELFLQTKQYVLAEEEADKALQQLPNDHRSHRNRALAKAGQYLEGRPLPLRDVMNGLEHAHDLEPGNLEVAERLVALYHKGLSVDDPAREQLADGVMEKMVQNNPNRQQAYLARYRYRKNMSLPGAEADLKQAVVTAPNNPAVILAAAVAAEARGDFDQAEGHFRRMIETRPADYRGPLGLGENLIRLGRQREAIDVWQHALTEVSKGRLPMLVRLADTQLALQDLAAAQMSIASLSDAISRLAANGQESQRDWAVASHGLLSAKLKIAREEFEDATIVLRRVATLSAGAQRGEQGADYQAWFLLGKTNLQLRRWEAAATSFERALQAAPRSNIARLWAARSWNALGRQDQAIRLCEHAIGRPPVPESIWLMLAELRMRQQLKLPPAERAWQPVSELLQQAANRLPDSWEIQVLIATQLVATETTDLQDEALQALQSAERIAPTSLPMWTRLMFLYDALGQRIEADQALQQVGHLSGDEALVSLYQAVLSARRGDYESAMKTLEEIDANRDDLRDSIERARLMLAYRQGDPDAARNVLLKRLESELTKTDALAQLTELAVFDHDWEQVERLVAELHDLEGQDGVLWRFFRAQLLLENAESETGQPVARALDLTEQIKAKRPWWVGTKILQARLAELRKEDTAAIDQYASVLRSGFKQASIYVRLIRLLHRQGRFVEADQWLDDLQNQQPLDPQFLDLAWSNAPDRNRLKLALRVGQKNVQLHPSEAVARVWLAQMLLVAGRPEEARNLIDEALVLKPEDAPAWTGLLSYFLRIGDSEQAIQALEVLQKLEDVPVERRHWIAAQTYRRLGRIEEAKTAYDQALIHAPTQVEILLDYARFLRAFDEDQAERVVRNTIQMAPSNLGARQLLAGWLNLSQESNDRLEARALLNPDGNRVEMFDRRAEAMVRMQSGRSDDRRIARAILEELVAAGEDRLEDRESLAMVYERDGDYQRAGAEWEMLVERSRPIARHLVGYIEHLLNQGHMDDVPKWLGRLEQQSPHSFSLLKLRVRYLLARGESEKMDVMIEDYVRRGFASTDKPAVERRMLRQVAEMLEGFEQIHASELRFAQLFERYPEEREGLVLFWVRNQQAPRALEMCLRAVQEQPSPGNATLLAKVLVYGEYSADFYRRSDQLLTSVQAEYPDDPPLLFALANLRLKQGLQQDAIEILRHLTRVTPQHVLAWNNLASILADQKGHQQEAMQCINQAIAVAGRPVPILFDTKAVLLIQAGDHEAAANLLKQAISLSNDADSRYQLHLAVAGQRLGDRRIAQNALRSAMDAGVRKAFLTDYELEWMTEVEESLAE